MTGGTSLRMAQRRVVILGGGASGVLLALHLLRDKSANVSVTIVERRDELGRGIAYATVNEDHILNVGALNMSAYAEEPDHFWRWLVARGEARDPSDPFCFASRRTYGRYLEDLAQPSLHESGPFVRLRLVHGECVAVDETASGVAVTLADGSTLIGHIAVIAVGHGPAGDYPTGASIDPWDAPALARIDRAARVLLLGTGLTMVDSALSLVGMGHVGPILALSRHGLLPQDHRRADPLRIDAADVPLGTGLTYLWRWFRTFVAWHAEGGGDWRGAIDAMRPHTQAIWQNLPPDAKRRFLRHARSWWDVHRHRMAPQASGKLQRLIASGQLQIMAARLCAIAPNEKGARVEWRRRGASETEELQVSSILDCRGMSADLRSSRNPILQDLFAKGLARPDPLQLGLDVSGDCALVDINGRASARLFAIGPLTRGALWEIVAIPDIRVQCERLARRLCRQTRPI